MAEEYNRDDDPLMGLEEDMSVNVPRQQQRPDRSRRPRKDKAPQSIKRVRALAAEFFGTFLLAFVVIAGLVVVNLLSDDAVYVSSILIESLIYGFAYGSIVYALSFNDNNNKISVRHLNPALTLVNTFRGVITPLLAVGYMAAQFLGAWVALFAVIHTVPAPLTSYTLTGSGFLAPLKVLDKVSLSHEFAASVLVGSCFFTLLAITLFDKSPISIIAEDAAPVTLSGADASEEVRAPTAHEQQCLIAAGTTVVCSAVLSPVTHDFMNPVLGMLTVHMTQTWSHWTVYTLPFVAAAAGAVLAILADWQIKALRTTHEYESVPAQGKTAGKNGGKRRRQAGVQMSDVYVGDEDDFDV